MLLFLVGLVLLIVGAEALVRGASRLAGAMGLSPLIVGLTVVAFGTSSPELAVSLKSALSDQASIALGNVVGSNILNVLFILGLSASIVPLLVARQLIRVDVPLMIGLSVAVLLLALDGVLGRVDGLLLMVALGVYLWFLVTQSRKESAAVKAEYAEAMPTSRSGVGFWVLNGVLVIGGLGLLVLGSRWLVDSAVAFATYMGISELIVGLTVVAAGTSLPEVVTSLIAAFRNERDIAVGNVVGSNLFNIMGVLGLSSAIAPSGIAVSPAVLGFDLPIMIAVALVCLPIFFTGGVISRLEGIALLAFYAAYTVYLVLAANAHDALQGFSSVMAYFVLPLTALTLIVVVAQEMRRRQSE